jgi:hypothetical protein
MHMPQPAVALERMAAAVRPGGWLCVEEHDFSASGAVDTQYPGASTFNQTSTPGSTPCVLLAAWIARSGGVCWASSSGSGSPMSGWRARSC